MVPTIFVLDVVFYSVLLALIWRVPSVMRSEQTSRMRDAMMPLLVVVAIGLVGWYVSYQDVLSPSSSNATTRPERRIVGSWTASDDASGMDFIFFFGDRSQDHSGFSMRVRGVEYNGRYSMAEERTVEISLEHSIALALEQKRGLCANAPSLLEGVCRRSVSSATALAASSPYPDPLPTPVPVVSGVIEDAVFNVDFDGDTMVLTSSSGAAERFSSSCASTWREWVRRSSE
ncbi:MAG TPA: hypothetical protein VER55_13800 [Ardenticatenaceae bacterium]|nr:hypothetical protein [Ardenticatenaceae bacterium]